VTRAAVLFGLMFAAHAQAHDVVVDLLGNVTTASQSNPRSGSAGVGASGSYDLTDELTVFGGATFLRDFGTRTPESSSAGSNVFLLNAGVMWLPTEHLMFMASLMGSPPSPQRNALTIDFLTGSADVVLNGTNASVGGSVLASAATAGDSRWEHTVDASVGVTHFESAQVVELGSGPRARLFRAACERTPSKGYCPLITGVSTPLTQVRLGAAYTATLFSKLDLSLDAAGFLFDRDPTSVGTFSTVVLGRETPDVGLGVPVAPWAFTARPAALYRFNRVSVRLAYQLGVYTAGLGFNHLVSLRLSVSVTRSVRLSLSVLGQTDVDQAGPSTGAARRSSVRPGRSDAAWTSSSAKRQWVRAHTR